MAESDCCVSGYLWEGKPKGKEEKLNGLDAYIARPASSGTPTTGIVVLPDVFGWTLLNMRLISDSLAEKTGAVVVLPELQQGLAAKPDGLDWLLTPAASNLERASRLLFQAPAGIFSLVRFLRACNDDATLPLMARAADGLRALGATKVAAVGFCWGGRYAALMGAGAAGGADAVVIAHPGVVSAEEYGKLRVPALFLLADPATEMSSNMGPKNLAATRAALAARPAPAPEAAFVEYAGCKHGFASRGCQGDEAVKKACVDAHERAAAFIVKHLA